MTLAWSISARSHTSFSQMSRTKEVTLVTRVFVYACVHDALSVEMSALLDAFASQRILTTRIMKYLILYAWNCGEKGKEPGSAFVT